MTLNPLAEWMYRLSTTILAESGRSFWMPPQASTHAADVDWVFHFIFYISVFFFVLIVAFMVLFIFLYRKREGHKEQESADHSTLLEITWSVIPLILVLIMFYTGFKTYMDMNIIPANTLNIYVTGQQWKWFFLYPNTHVDDTLHVPVDRPVKLIITSDDVTHSLFIPAFRLKKDAVPGRYTTAWFNANQTGTFPLFCAEYCGTDHSDMQTIVEVHEPGGYEKWLEQAANIHQRMTPVQAGEYLYARRGCAQCHSIDGTANKGPSFKDLFGKEGGIKGGGIIKVDENYIRESILDPGAKVAEGYDNIMPPYQGKLKEEDLIGLIEYIRSLNTQKEE
jgi:cytochrome c oxidase subunit II